MKRLSKGIGLNLKQFIVYGPNYVKLLFKYSRNPVTLILGSITAGGKGHVFLKLKSGEALRIKVWPTYYLLFLLNRGQKIVEWTDEHVILKKDVYLKCRYKKGADLGHIKEVFEDLDYGTGQRNAYVIDVGASSAESAIYFAARGALKVLALEPVPESNRLALENIRMNNLQQKIVLLNKALSASDGIAEFLIPNEYPNISSLSTPGSSKAIDSAHYDRVRVGTVTLESLIEEYGLPKVDLLKMDCEGCEYSVLRNMGQETLSKIGEIILEYHDGPKDLPTLLSSVGFTVDCTDTLPVGYIKAHRTRV